MEEPDRGNVEESRRRARDPNGRGRDTPGVGTVGSTRKKEVVHREETERRGDSFRLRMTNVLARHGLTIEQAGELPDSALRRHRGVGTRMIGAIRAVVGGAAPALTREAEAAPDRRLAALERHVADLAGAIRDVQTLLRVRGVDRRGLSSRGQVTRPLRKGDTKEPRHDVDHAGKEASFPPGQH
jgi:hypothetical protein